MAKTLQKIIKKSVSKTRFSATWTWNSCLEEDEFTNQLNEFKEKGFSTIIIKPSRQMNPRYLTEDFFAFLNKALEEASRQSITIKIAESMVGGTCSYASQLANKEKKSRLSTCTLVEEINVRSKKIFIKELKEDQFALAIHVKDGEAQEKSVKSLKPSAKDGKISWHAPHGEWIVYIFQTQFQFSPLSGYQADFFNSHVTASYAGDLYQTFKENIPVKHWKKTFGGFVFELPHSGPSGRSVFWSESLLAKYKVKFKQDFTKTLIPLYRFSGKRTPKLRNDYYSFVQKFFTESLVDQMVKTDKKYKLESEYYCSAVNPFSREDSLLTVPEWSTKSSMTGCLLYSSRNDNSAAAAKLIYRNLGTGKNTVKTVLGQNTSSASSTLQQLKHEITKQALWGGRNWVFDGAAYQPKPQNHPFTPNNPFQYSPSWPYFSRLVDYAKTFSGLMESVNEETNALILFPRTALYASYTPAALTDYQKTLSAFRNAGTLCARLNIGFDTMDESELPLGKLGKTDISYTGESGKSSYKVIIVPRASAISEKALALLKQAASKNIPVFWIDSLPSATEKDGIAPTVRKQLEDIQKKHAATFKVFENAADMETALQSIFAPKFRTFSQDKKDEELYSAVFKGKHSAYILQNLSDSKPKRVDVMLNSTDKIYLADCDKQEIYKFPKAQPVGKTGYQFDLDLQPRQSYVIISSPNAVSTAKGHLFEVLAGNERKYRIIFKNQWTFRPDQNNMLPLSHWNTRISGSRENNGLFRFCETILEIEEVPENIKFVLNGLIDQPVDDISPFYKHVEIAINGVKLKEFQLRSLFGETAWTPDVSYSHNNVLGHKVLEADIAGMLHKGFNRITVRSMGSYYSPQSIEYPPFITGDFSLKRGSRGWVIASANTELEYGSWADQGYPYFSGSGTYSQVFERPDSFHRLVVSLKEVEEIAILRINGQEIEVFPYEPREVDVTNFTLQGRNEISIQVFNTIDNVTKLNYRTSGLSGEVFLDVY